MSLSSVVTAGNDTRALSKSNLFVRRWRNYAVVLELAIALPVAALAQTVTATLATGTNPVAIAVNPVTNKVYVSNDDGTITVIDGATNRTLSVGQGTGPYSVAVNPVTNKVYVANQGSNNVTVIDGATNSTVNVAAGSKPYSVAVNPVTNKIYVANVNGNNLTVIDGATNSTTTVATGTSPFSVAVNPVTNKIYVTNLNSNNLTVINGANNSTATVPTGLGPYSVAVNPATNQIYVANAGGDSVTIVDSNNNNSTASVAVGDYPISVTVNPVTNKIYVANDLGNSVTVINGYGNSTATLAVGSFPVSLAVNSLTNKIYVADNGGGETVIDGRTNGVTQLGAAGTYPTYVAVNQVTDKVYVTNYGSNTVTLIDGDGNTTNDVAASGRPEAVAVNPVTNKFYVTTDGAGSSPGNLLVIAGQLNNAVSVPVGSSPDAIAVNPLTNRIYVANKGSNTVSVIDGTNNSEVTLAVGSAPSSLAVNAVTNQIFVVNSGIYPTFASSVTVIDGASSGIITTVSVGSGSSPIVVNPVTNRAYLITGGLGSNPAVLTVIDAANNYNVRNTNGGAAPNSLALNTMTNTIYTASSSESTVTMIDGATYGWISFPLGVSPNSVTVNPLTNKIYLTNYYDASVSVFDGASFTTTSVATGQSPTQALVNPVTNKIYVANFNSNSVTVIDGATNTTTAVETNLNPRYLAFNPVTNQVYAANFSSDDLTVIGDLDWSIPLTTSIMPLANNQTSDSNPGFTLSAAGIFNPIVTTPNAVYYQVDTWQGAWSTASGANPSFLAELSSLQPGFHILYAFAGDGQQATSTQAGAPLTGEITAYGFVVTGSGTLQPQTVTFVNLPAQGGAGTSITLSATASTSVTFSSSSPVSICSVSGTTLTFSGTGVCSVTAVAGGNNLYQPASTSHNINVLLGQTITFTAIPTQSVNATLALNATAGSGLPVSFTSSTAGICTVSGTSASFIAPGTCTIKATQVGNSSYAAATPVARSFNVTSESGLGFIPVTPCRVVDTRDSTSSLGGPTMAAGSTRSFPLPIGSCALPATASAYSLNVTVVPHTTLQYLSLWPSGQTRPVVSTLNSFDGRTVANAAIVPAGTNGAVDVYVTDQTDVIIDVDGYFGAAGSSGALTFVPVAPCRVEDTRNANGPFGGPILSAGSSRSFAIPSSSCGIPATASAYSLNATVVPTATLQYLTLYSTGSSRPDVSTLNSYNGQVVANAAIVPAGASGAVTAYVTDQTDLITDVNGYFTSRPPTPLVFNTVTPCRVADTRNANATFGGPIMAANSTRSFPIPESACGIPSSATAYALNVTVVPTSTLSYLTLWPNGESQPTVSTLNSDNGQVVANAAMVPAGQSGAVEVFVTDQTHVIIDIVGYFSAP